MIPYEQRQSGVGQFRDGSAGIQRSTFRDMTTAAVVQACFHALEEDYDTSDLAERDDIRVRHLQALAVAIWFENQTDFALEEEREDVRRLIDDLLNNE